MSKTYFSADWHLSHSSAIQYCNRPFKTMEEMNDVLINNANSRFKEDDTFIHVGDFCFTSKTIKTKAIEYERRINAKLIHVLGNHDVNNSVKGVIHSLMIKLGDKDTLVIHKPPESLEEIPDRVQIVLCGHVHTAWKHIFLKDDNRIVPVINVGCDVWSYRPIDLGDIHGYWEQIMRGNKNGI